VYTGNDIIPFNFYLINSELGTESTFSTINMGSGVISRGERGYILATQDDTVRTDLEIPDQVFQIKLIDNGAQRMCAQRDFVNEWIYFTYPSNRYTNVFPTETLLYNYRDKSYALFRESYTTYGQFRRSTGFTWNTVGLVYPTWKEWNDPWNAGTSTLLQTEVIVGNSQGVVLTRADGTGEANSIVIQNITSNGIIASPGHSLNNGDYIIIKNTQGSVSQYVNSKIFQVFNATADTFKISPSIPTGFTYQGGGVIQRMYVPFIQTKQFPTAWGMARKTRIGVQQYLLTTTASAQITLQIYLSQNNQSPYNTRGVVPLASANRGLVYSSILYTCPESTNLGLTPANTNLQMIVDTSTGVSPQDQIWHRMNTSLIGDTVQIGFTLDDTQMRDLQPASTSFTITAATATNPVVITTIGTSRYSVGQLVSITGVQGMIELNDNYPNVGKIVVISSTGTSITLDIDGSTFTAYTTGGTVVAVSPNNQFAEIELHGFILDVTPSQVLA
jgi:hypothetical protein